MRCLYITLSSYVRIAISISNTCMLHANFDFHTEHYYNTCELRIVISILNTLYYIYRMVHFGTQGPFWGDLFGSQGPLWVTGPPFLHHTGNNGGWTVTWGRSLVQLRRTRRIGLCGKIAPWQQLPARCDQHSLVAITQNREENSIGPDLTKWPEARYGESSSPNVPTIPYFNIYLFFHE